MVVANEDQMAGDVGENGVAVDAVGDGNAARGNATRAADSGWLAHALYAARPSFPLDRVKPSRAESCRAEPNRCGGGPQ